MTGREQIQISKQGGRSIPVSDANWLAPLLDADGVATALAGLARTGAPEVRGCKIKHVRYRPGASCTVLYDVQLATSEGCDTISIYARLIAPGRTPASLGVPPLDTRFETSGRILAGPAIMKPFGAVLREFPLDATIPSLLNLLDEEGFARGLATQLSSSGTVPTRISSSFVRLRYKPEHRLVLRAELSWRDPGLETVVERTCQVRFEYGVDLVQRANLISRLSAAIPASGLLVAPGPEIHLSQTGCSVIEWRQGHDLAGQVHRGDTAAAAVAGRSLAALGMLEISGLEVRHPSSALDISRSQIEMLHKHPPSPGIAARFTSITDRLSHIDTSGFPGLVHGDFHQGQLLTREDQVCVLDWDRAHLGDQACDFGRFLAQLVLLDLRGKLDSEPMARAFREAFAAQGGTVPGPDRERYWTVVALADLALREVRRLRPDWLDRVELILDRCESLLQGEPLS